MIHPPFFKNPDVYSSSVTCFRGQLHQAAYVSRLEEVIKVLIDQNKLTAEDIERIWNVRLGC